MKRVFSLFAFFMTVVTFFSCNKETDPTDEVKNDTKELIVTAEASDIDYNAVTLYGYANLSEGMTGVTFGVIVSEDENPTVDNGRVRQAKELDENNKFRVEIEDLSIGTKYYYKAYLKEGDYYRTGTKILSFSTKGFTEETIATGETLTVRTISATLNGTTDLPTTFAMDLFGFFISEEETPTVDNSRVIVSDKWDGDNSFFCNVSGLMFGTKYYYRAYFEYKGEYHTGKTFNFTTKNIEKVQTAVDLGLSVKWGSCNIGASSPMEYGDYYAWGETETKADYSWYTYKWCKGSFYTLTKYNTRSSRGVVDNKTVLDPEDDVAHLKLGGKWRMPTGGEFSELMSKCTWQKMKKNDNTIVYFVEGPSGNAIALPAAGGRYVTSLDNAGSYGNYWSSSLSEDYSDDARIVYFDSEGVGSSGNIRYSGLSVRPVSE